LTLPDVQTDHLLAVPPVRQRELAESFPGRIYSICGSDYGRILADVGRDIVGS
jgi:hypothetical protein